MLLLQCFCNPCPGTTNRDCHRDTEALSWEIPPPLVFCRKSLDLLDSKGVDYFGSDKEFVTVSNGEGYVWSGERGRRGFFEITRAIILQIWTSVNSKLVSSRL